MLKKQVKKLALIFAAFSIMQGLCLGEEVKMKNIYDLTKENKKFEKERVENEIGGPYKGAAILGNKNTCYVYNESSQNMVAENGITHLYFDDFAFDYLACLYPVVVADNSLFSAIRRLKSKNDKLEFNESISFMEDYFSPKTAFPIFEDGIAVSKTFSLQSGGIVLSTNLSGGYKSKLAHVIKFQNSIPLITKDEKTKSLVFKYSNGKSVCFAYKNSDIDFGFSKKLNDIIEGSFDQKTPDKKTYLFIYQKDISNVNQFEELYIVPESSEYTFSSKIEELRAEKDNYLKAKTQWDGWIAKGKIPKFSDKQLEKYYKSNLAALLGVYLKGAIPADVTGQFLTNDLPQLYPRDALMTARSFFITGHYEEAANILNFWNKVTNKDDGEFYARYDANAKAVDGGSGASYDVPEWDFNGYYTSMMLWLWEKNGKWDGDISLVEKMAKFIKKSVNEKGLLFEGGIIEWPGYLPATHMNVAAGLWDAAVILTLHGKDDLARECMETAAKIEKGLKLTYNEKEKTYMDIRNDNFAYCSSFNFGCLWGYPNHTELEESNKWILKNIQQSNGGIQYFDGRGGAESYGDDLFFFTTGAAAEYQAEYGSFEEYSKMVKWMIANSNKYSLMPERILYPDKPSSSPASPLSWCNGEFVNSLYYGAKRGWLVNKEDSTKKEVILERIDIISKYSNKNSREKLEKLSFYIKEQQYNEGIAYLNKIDAEITSGNQILDFHIKRYIVKLKNEILNK